MHLTQSHAIKLSLLIINLVLMLISVLSYFFSELEGIIFPLMDSLNLILWIILIPLTRREFVELGYSSKFLRAIIFTFLSYQIVILILEELIFKENTNYTLYPEPIISLILYIYCELKI